MNTKSQNAVYGVQICNNNANRLFIKIFKIRMKIYTKIQNTKMNISIFIHFTLINWILIFNLQSLISSA